MGDMKPIYVRITDVQQVFGLHRSTVHRMAKRGEITIHKRGHSAFIKTKDMEALIEGEAYQTLNVGQIVGQGKR